MAERPKGPDLIRYQRYRTAQGYKALYSAAARLWKEGVAMSRAINIVSDAMAAASARNG